MFAFATGRLASFVILGLTIGAYTAAMDVELPSGSGKEMDLVCSKIAKENGGANATEVDCAYKNTESGLGGATAPKEYADDSIEEENDLVTRENCQEGSLEKCLQDCAQYNPGGYESGESGAWAGCRASCNYRCGPKRGGCYHGYCWAGCMTGFPLLEGVEWCYTTKTYSQSYQYVKCSRNDECNLDWKCAGPCAAF